MSSVHFINTHPNATRGESIAILEMTMEPEAQDCAAGGGVRLRALACPSYTSVAVALSVPQLAHNC